MPAFVRFVRTSWATIAAWLSIATLLVVLQHVSVTMQQGAGFGGDGWRGLRSYLGGWIQFDGWEYVSIAEEGYWYEPASRAPVVFFPLYPMAVRSLGWLVSDPVLAAMGVSAVAGLVAVVLYRRWLDVAAVSAQSRPWSMAVFLVYPYGWFLYGPVYSDALFVMLIISAFLLVESDRLALAGVVGAFVTATRPTGLAIIPALLVLAVERRGVLTAIARPGLPAWVTRVGLPTGIDRSRLSPRVLWTLLSVGGVATYSAYLAFRWGNPLLWATSQSEYSGSGPKTWFKAGFVAQWLEWDDPVYLATISAQALIMLGVLISIPLVGRRFGWGYATFVACLVAIPMVTSRDFIGVGRYLLPAFPVAALLGEYLSERRVVRVVWVVVSMTALVILSMGFSRSRMLS